MRIVFPENPPTHGDQHTSGNESENSLDRLMIQVVPAR